MSADHSTLNSKLATLADWPAPPCQVACPVHTDARRYVSLIAQERYEEALDAIMAANPLPSVIGRICAHPCEQACRRAQVDEPIAICSLKRFVTDKLGYSDGKIKVNPARKTKNKSIAIVGSGPSGLTAAHDLARQGYGVTIFEKHPEPGGMLKYGILDYRLPPEVLQSDIENILATGIELKCGVDIGHTLDFQELINDYDAVLVAVGLATSRSVPMPGVDLQGVHLALPVLKAINEGRAVDLGKDIIVVGGGNVAVDVARSVRRLNDKTVKMVCLEAREEMPAHDWEIEDAMAEGVEIHCSWGPDRIAGEHGRVTALEFKECTCVFDKDRRFSPKFNEAKRHALSADTIILAIGQGGDLSFLKNAGIKLNDRGQLEFDRATMSTSHPEVFAAGEIVTGPGAAINAIANGHRAAEAIAAYLEERAPIYQKELVAVADLPESISAEIKHSERRQMRKLADDRRLESFSEVELGFDVEDALRESQRCLSCTAGAVVNEPKCAACLTCVRVCPFKVPEMIGDKAYMNPLTCQSCGICASECPAEAITVKMTKEQLLPLQIGIDAMETKYNPISKSPATIGFICQFGHAWGADRTFDVMDSLPDNIRIARVLCPSRLSPADILQAFEAGAERVFITYCGSEYCHYKTGNGLTLQRIDYVRTILDGAGIGGDKLVSYSIDHNTSLADIIEEMNH